MNDPEFDRPMQIANEGGSQPLKAIAADVSHTAYPELHAHVLELARLGLLIVVDEAVNKDTEMHPLVRWQYRGVIPENTRRASNA